jgi:membrane fusion protein (multidrug efflux system)
MATTVESSPSSTAPGRAQPTAGGPPPPQAAPVETPKPRRNLVVPIVIVVVLIGAIWAFRTWNYSRAHESTDDAQLDGHIIPVLAKVGGFVTGVHGDDNVPVRERDTIVTIDSRDYKVALAQADANLAAAEAAVGTASHGRLAGGGAAAPAQIGQALADVQTAQGRSAADVAQIVAAQANYDKAAEDLKRYKVLADQAIVSRQQLDAAEAAADAAQAQLVSAQKQAIAASASVSGAQAGVRLAVARLGVAQAERDNAALQLSYTAIIAPANGVMSHKQVEPGQLVQAGQTLFNVVADTGVYITANYKETQLNDVRVGQLVDFTVDAYPGCTAQGKVESLSPATGARFALLPPDNATGNFTKVVQRVPIKIQIARGCGSDRPLRPGMSVTSHIVTKQ